MCVLWTCFSHSTSKGQNVTEWKMAIVWMVNGGVDRKASSDVLSQRLD
uniref:Uncharacterized protein n=1 Tax=Anguilla anguilla TaxID=7936 RepID=A0A0E9PPE4_ANGAN